MTLDFRWSIAIALGVSALFALFAPVAVAWWWRRRSGASWKTWAFGVVVFVVSQCLLRLPWQIPLGRWVGPHIHGNAALSVAWIAASSLTAGIFEECGRWAGYKWLAKREYSFRAGVMLGLGHGGIESVLLVGLSIAGTLVVYALLGAHVPIGLPPEAQDKVVAQLSALEPWDATAGAVERAMALTVHVALSLVVLQAFVRKSGKWVALAVLLHFLIDFTSVEGTVLLKSYGALVQEIAVVPSLVLAVLLIRALRPKEARDPAT
jgi:uncharacterized membrane protein YhfC